MIVTVSLYAALREAAGRGLIELDVPHGARVADVLDRLVEVSPESRPFRPVMRGAVDDAYVPSDTPLGPGAELHVITPVSGG